MSQLKEKFIKEVVPAMKKKFGYKNDLAVPRIKKVVVNVGIGKISREKKIIEEVTRDLTMITGQKPALQSARKSVAGFKLRKGMIIGLKVTLRGKRMWDFIQRLIGVALPRIRDFRGIDKKSFDGQGNLTIGIKEHIVFPEMIGEEIEHIFGLEISVVTSAENDEEGYELLKLIGFPLKE
jgi:large subunit ribosomal protein L5